MSKLSAAAPPEKKVVAGGTAGGSVLVAAWALIAYVPAIHNALPATLSQLLPGLLAVVGGGIAAWMAKHTPRLEEVMQLVLELVEKGETGTAGQSESARMAAVSSDPAATQSIPATEFMTQADPYATQGFPPAEPFV
jgi:hypothetical protein